MKSHRVRRQCFYFTPSGRHQEINFLLPNTKGSFLLAWNHPSLDLLWCRKCRHYCSLARRKRSLCRQETSLHHEYICIARRLQCSQLISFILLAVVTFMAETPAHRTDLVTILYAGLAGWWDSWIFIYFMKIGSETSLESNLWPLQKTFSECPKISVSQTRRPGRYLQEEFH